jgi:5'-nucleotidase
MRKLRKLTATVSLFLAYSLVSCGTTEKNLTSEINPTQEKQEADIETIAIAGTNDIHGALAIETDKTRESDPALVTEYRRAGMPTLASYIRILRKQLGDRLLWLDAGDEFQGSIESNMEKGKAMVGFFNLTGLQGAAIGNHEFDFGPETNENTDRLSALKTRMSEAQYPYLSANILNTDSGKPEPFPNTYPSKMYNVGKLKVGVIGLTTLDTPKTTISTNIRTLNFTDLKEATLREARALRDAGADIVVSTAHVGLMCDSGRASTTTSIRRPADLQGSCDKDDELVTLLNSLPAGTLDGVVAGHSHQLVHHWIAGVPVIQGGSFGRYFNVLYFRYDLKNRKILPDRTRIEGPIPVCTEIFKYQNDCNGDRPAPKNGRGPLVKATFHGETIHPDSKASEFVDAITERAAKLKNEIISVAARPIEHERMKESPLGNLIADAIRDQAHADLAIINSGGIRAPIDQGEITYGEVFRTLPFSNTITTLKVSGKELLEIIRIAESGSRGVSPFSGLQLKLIAPEYDAPSSDLNGDNRIDPWEINRLVNAHLSNGETIEPNQYYTLATLDFLVEGGDDMGWILKQIPKQRVTPSSILIRDTTLAFMKKIAAAQGGTLNSLEHPLADSSHPRIEFTKAKTSSQHSKKGSGKKRRRRNARM